MKKRIVSTVLLLALILGQMPARAADAARPGGELSGSVTVVNPLYSGVPDATADGLSGVARDAPTVRSRAANTTRYTDIASAAAFVRSQMANRQQIVTLSYRAAGNDDQKASIVRSIVSKALEETGNENEGDYLRWQYQKFVCNIEGDWVANGDGTRTYNYKFIYSFTYYTTAQQERELNEELTRVLRSLNLGGATEYQQIQRIYAYVCTHVAYEYNDPTTMKYTAYSALTRGRAVCQGYALLLYRMLREMGFSARIIAGTSAVSGENHAWNIVKLGGAYYYLDSTWDAGSSQSWYDYFLRGGDTFSGHTAWSDYMSDEFVRAYPMARRDYTPDSADLPDEGLLGQGTCGNDITWRLSADGVLTLRGSGRMDDYTQGGAPWARLRDRIRSLDIGCGITSIGSYAFAGCTSLTQAAILPDSVRRVGAGAFAGCTSLPSVDVMPQATEVAADAFARGTAIRGCTGSAAQAAASRAGLTFYAVTDIADATVRLSQDSYSYDGTARTPRATVTAADGTAVSATVAYCDNVNAGTAQVLVSGSGAYGGRVGVAFAIEKAKPTVQPPRGLAALCGQTLNDVLLGSRFSWQQPARPVGTKAGAQTFLLTYTPVDTRNYSTVTDVAAHVTVQDTIGLSSRSAQTFVGAQMRLIPSAIPDNAPADILFWESGNPAVAEVSPAGVVTAKSIGKAVITVRSVGGESAQCALSVGRLPFSDVPSGAWYFDAVSYSYGNRLFAGDSATTFRPGRDMTRAMLVQVLYNLEGKPAVSQAPSFRDVPTGKWYTSAIAWAAANNVVSGMGNGTFSPDGVLTREQTAQILYNYAARKGYPTTARVGIDSYDDGGDVSAWAVSAMRWAVDRSLISGTGGNLLSPGGKASRAQVAQIMMQFDYNIVYR